MKKTTNNRKFVLPKLIVSGKYEIADSKGCMKYPSKCGRHTHTR